MSKLPVQHQILQGLQEKDREVRPLTLRLFPVAKLIILRHIFGDTAAANDHE